MLSSCLISATAETCTAGFGCGWQWVTDLTGVWAIRADQAGAPACAKLPITFQCVCVGFSGFGQQLQLKPSRKLVAAGAPLQDYTHLRTASVLQPWLCQTPDAIA